MYPSSSSSSPQTGSLEHSQPRATLDNDATTQHGFHSSDDIPTHGDSSSAAILNPSELEHHVEPRYVRANRKPTRNRNRPDALTHKQSDVTSDQDDDSHQDQPYSWISLLPHEALTRVLAHLDPTSLARAAAVSRLWHAIVKDDVTWRLALCNSFAISQDGSGASIALRRTNKASWKAEYIHRTDLIKRWKRSRAPAISSDMGVSNISAIAFADVHSFLISASFNHGIASRSDPFKGKVARGFLDAAGALNGAGAAHPPPHLEPSAGITAAALSRDASRVLWGFHDGTISITLLTRQGSNPRGVIRTIRLSPTGAHTGPVTALAFDLNQRGQTRRQHRRVAMGDVADCFASGGQDGRVRLWTHNKHLPIWFASTQDDVTPVNRPHNALAAITQVDLDADLGIVVAGTTAGDVHIWSGINIPALLSISSSAWDSDATEIQTAAQIQARKALALEHARVQHVLVKSAQDPAHQAQIDAGAQDVDASVDHLFLDTSTEGEVNVIAHRGSDSHLALHRLSSSTGSKQDAFAQTHILETDSTLDAITCLRVDCAPASIVDHSASGTPQHSATPSPALAPITLPDSATPLPAVVLGPAPGSTRNLHGGVFAERKFVCAGTSNGNLFGWPIPTPETTSTHLRPNFKLDCHHTALTSVDFTPHLFAVGTSDGTVKSFNSLTGEPVRTCNERTATRHAARMLNQGTLTVDEADRFRVKQIIIGAESIVAAIGPFLLAWRPGSATSGRRNKGNGPGGTSAASSSGGTPIKANPGRSTIPPLSKYAQMREIKTELAESSAALAKEKEQRQASYDRIKYTRATADIGGLNEDEAMEYALMLSREEEESRQISEAHRKDETQSHLSELARIHKEEAELQEALEQIALAEGDDSLCSSGVPSSRASDAPASPPDAEDGDEYAVDSGDEYDGKEDYDASQHPRTSLSPGPSPGLSGYGSPTRAWSILNNAGSSASASPATARSRWGDNSKVRMVSVPRSSRLSLSPSAGNTPPPPLSAPDASMLSSPEHWPTMSTSLSSSGGRSPLAEGSFSLGPSRIPYSSHGFSSKPSQQQQPSRTSTSQDEGFISNISKGKRPQSDLSAPSPLVSPSPLAPSPAAASSPAIQGVWAKGSPQVKPSPPAQSGSGSFANAAVATAPSSTSSTSSRTAAAPLDDMDDDLRFVIELSLAEERSRGSQ